MTGEVSAAGQCARRIELSVVVALHGAQANIPEILAALPLDQDGAAEILLCRALDDPQPTEWPVRPDMRIVDGRPGSLIPELWRDGFREARGEWVATLTAHCPPTADWLARALALIREDATERHAAFGGAIVADGASDRVTRAIQVLRYADAGAIARRQKVQDLSADNAIYRRASVLACADLMADGFWEPNYHRRFLENGQKLELIPDLVVVHRNRYSAREFMRQRRLHGRVFGRHRGEAGSLLWNWVMFIASPAAFAVFATKQSRKILSRPELRAQLRGSVALYYLFMAYWCLGEIAGYFDALRARMKIRS